MAKENFDLSAPANVLLAFKFSAQQCNATLSGWIAFCCCSQLPMQEANSLHSRRSKPPTRLAKKVSVEDIAAASSRSTRETLSCPSAYRNAWGRQAETEKLGISHWIIRCCTSYLNPILQSEVIKGLPQDCPSKTSQLGFKLMSLHYRMDEWSQKYWLGELGVADIALASHLTTASPILLDELNQLTNRLLDLCNCFNSFSEEDSEIDSKLRYYFDINYRHRKLVLRSESELSEPEKIERMRTAKILFKLQQLASDGAAYEQVFQGQDSSDRFVSYVAAKTQGQVDLPASLKEISACDYLKPFAY